MASICRYSPRLLFAAIFLISFSISGQEPLTKMQQQPPASQSSASVIPPRQTVQESEPPLFLQVPQELPRFPAVAAPRPQLQEGAYLFIYRTPAHVKRSDPGIFHNAARAVRELLRSHQVAMFDDPVRGTIETAETFSMESVLNLARSSEASYLLYVTIDRPMTKWLKISLQCYDLNGKLLWQEDAARAGGWTSGDSIRKVTSELEKRLAPRFGGTGLPRTLPGSAEQPAGKGGDNL